MPKDRKAFLFRTSPKVIAAVERLAELSVQNSELTANVEELQLGVEAKTMDASTVKIMSDLRTERDDAQAQLASMLELVKKLSSEQSSSTYRSSVRSVFQLPDGDRAAALKRLTWDDLDAEVAKQNADMDNQRSLPPTNEPTASVAGPDAQLSDLRTRLRSKLRKLLHDSNSIRIRSAALSPTKTNASASRGMLDNGSE